MQMTDMVVTKIKGGGGIMYELSRGGSKIEINIVKVM